MPRAGSGSALKRWVFPGHDVFEPGERRFSQLAIATPTLILVNDAGGARFPRSLRLLDKKAFQRVFENPIRLSGKYFVIHARRNDCGHPRLGLAVSKKAVKTAVERNRVKRVCRESFRHNQTELPAVDIVIMVHRSGVADVSNAALNSALSELWSKLVARCARS